MVKKELSIVETDRLMLIMAEPDHQLSYEQFYLAIKEMLFNDFDKCVKAGFEKLEIRPDQICI